MTWLHRWKRKEARTGLPEPEAGRPVAGVEQGRLIHPQTLMAIQNLELRARIVVQGFWNGIHRSPYHGFSVEFTEYRQYSPGDDTRYLDWRLFARSDRFYIKKFEDETNLRCYLLVDHSRSMTFGSLAYNKSQYASTLAATLGYFLNGQGDAVGLLTFDAELRHYLPARHRPGHLRHLMLALEQPASGLATDLNTPLRRITELVRKRGLVILISDLLAPLDSLEDSLMLLTASGHEAILFQILDPAEIHFSYEKAVLFQDVESGQKVYVDPEAARREYLARLAEHTEATRSICQKLGIAFHRLATDQPMELALFDFLRERLKRDSKGRRHHAVHHSGS